MLNTSLNAESLRKSILVECCNHSKVTARKSKQRVVKSQIQVFIT
ncbi:hypothetical protein GBAR_LOCUS20939 [Geodia barretti]|uniref:Uncharacterized protein n=1 Tax=Geodia barretti TaxID=519541 RepID=A0AA35SX08_GEOBA|nr:hypothetical protein GBAR_LOCUS20939 [Geodia barretti]